MKKYIKFTTVLLFLGFLIHTSCNNDDDVPPVPDTDVDDPDAVDDDDPAVSADYLVLKAFYEANTNNTLGWDLDDTSMKSWAGVTANNDKVTQLSARGKSIDSVPPVLGELKEITTLDISKNSVLELPVEIGELKSLDILDLEDNIFKIIPQEVCDLETIGTKIAKNNDVYCSGDGVVADYLALKALYDANPDNTLNSLGLGSWDLTDISMKNWHGVGLNTEGRVYVLDMKNAVLGGTGIEIIIPSEIGNLSELNELWLGGNIRLLPQEIKKLTKLTILSLVSTELVTMQPQLFELKSLNYLNIQGSSIQVIPEQIIELEVLEKLYISSSDIKSVPEVMEEMKSLTILNLYGNQIQNVPSSLSSLSNLSDLDLRFNLLMEIPQEVCNLANTGTVIEKDADVFCSGTVDDYEVLKALNDDNGGALNWNGTISDMLVPGTWEGVTIINDRVTRLELAGKGFTILPDNLGDISELVYLNLANNDLRDVPDSVGELIHLEELYLQSQINSLARIPEELGNLVNLKQLYIQNNPDLICIPQAVLDLAEENGGTTNIVGLIDDTCSAKVGS